MHAYGEALRHVDRALELWDQVDAPEEASGTDGSTCCCAGRSSLAGRGTRVAPSRLLSRRAGNWTRTRSRCGPRARRWLLVVRCTTPDVVPTR